MYPGIEKLQIVLYEMFVIDAQTRKPRVYWAGGQIKIVYMVAYGAA